MSKLPASVQEIANVIGRERALFLIGKLPRFHRDCHPSGQPMLYIPKTLRADHPLVELMGFQDAHKLVKAFGGEILQPASCQDVYRTFRDKSIIALLMAGLRPRTIADLFDVSDRHVRNLAREISQEDHKGAANDNRQNSELTASA